MVGTDQLKVFLIRIFIFISFTYGPFVFAQTQNLPYTPVITPNGSTMPWTLDKDRAKVFHITVDQCKHEIAPGMVINAWCYNGQTPGPTIEVMEGDLLRIYVTNKLPEATAVHWHGVFVPNGMDGVAGLTQKAIEPGQTFKYEFRMTQHGTFMYHSHGDEMVQMGLGTMGFLISHARDEKKVDRDFAIFLNEWFVEPGTKTPNPNIMTDFNIFTFNSRAFPGTAPLVAKTGDRVRIRIGNVGQESHPIHLHGYSFKVVATDGGDIPESAQWPDTTVAVFPGQTRTVEFVANRPGNWALHCHRRHHPMNAMGHDAANVIGVNQDDVKDTVRDLVPGYMAMGEAGMDEMNYMQMKGPENTLPMMGGQGQFGPTGMGGMFTVFMVRDNLKDYDHPGDYPYPKGTVASMVEDDTQ